LPTFSKYFAQHLLFKKKKMIGYFSLGHIDFILQQFKLKTGLPALTTHLKKLPLLPH
jgi:hypothetical protein